MTDWSHLRRVLALLCVIVLLFTAAVPDNGQILLALLVPVEWLAMAISITAKRIDTTPPGLAPSPFLSVLVGRAPPVY
ncbi:MAG: hypothetical protein H7Y20_00195 [Bryobacteraceae bacterium]|nr:hypothetical protein [Bryobacteraceae bacterium]